MPTALPWPSTHTGKITGPFFRKEENSAKAQLPQHTGAKNCDRSVQKENFRLNADRCEDNNAPNLLST